MLARNFLAKITIFKNHFQEKKINFIKFWKKNNNDKNLGKNDLNFEKKNNQNFEKKNNQNFEKKTINILGKTI